MKSLKDIFEGIFDKKNVKNVGKNISDSIYPLPTTNDWVSYSYCQKELTWYCKDFIQHFIKKYKFSSHIEPSGLDRIKFIYNENTTKLQIRIDDEDGLGMLIMGVSSRFIRFSQAVVLCQKIMTAIKSDIRLIDKLLKINDEKREQILYDPEKDIPIEKVLNLK